MSDVAVVIGHHPEAPGAELELANRSVYEYDFWKPFGRELALTLEASGIEATVVERPNEDPDAALAKRVNATHADAAIELHFNSFDGRAKGSEMFHWETSGQGKRLAMLLQEHVTNALGTDPRRVEGTREFPFLQLTRMPAVICEPAFGSAPQDAWALLTGQAELLRAYRQALSEYLQASRV